MLNTFSIQKDENGKVDFDELAFQLFDFIKVKAKVKPLYYVDDGGTLRFRFHKYQQLAMEAKERFILLLGGTQSGKTSFGPIWLEREIRLRGPGDYLAVAPTFPLMSKKMLPEFLKYFQDLLKLGTYNIASKVFKISSLGEIFLFGSKQEQTTQIYFGHAQDADSLESATAKAAWLDEAGQSKFRLTSFEAIIRRLSLHLGRMLITTTPYNLGWLKQKFWDVWEKGKAKAKSIKVISFPSIANPSFPKSEYYRARDELPRWKFDMFYRAIFTRPLGMIYDCFKDVRNKIKDFLIPDNWEIFSGLDFGGVHTGSIKLAQDPLTKIYYLFEEYLEGGKTAKEHAKDLTIDYPPLLTYGGANSEGQWRNEFSSAGLPVHAPPITSVEVGIDLVYGLIKKGLLVIFESCEKILDEIGSYSRETNSEGKVLENIMNKSTYHLLDALRYIVVGLLSDAVGGAF